MTSPLHWFHSHFAEMAAFEGEVGRKAARSDGTRGTVGWVCGSIVNTWIVVKWSAGRAFAPEEVHSA